MPTLHKQRISSLKESKPDKSQALYEAALTPLSCFQRANYYMHQLQDRLENAALYGISRSHGDRYPQIKKSASKIKTKGGKLEVIESGAELCIDENEAHRNPLVQSSPVSVKHAKVFSEMESMFLSVYHLLGHIETDRVNTLQLFQSEQKRTKSLRHTIDELIYNRIDLLAESVQREHTIWLDDLCELKWHHFSRSIEANKLEKRVESAQKVVLRTEEQMSSMASNSNFIKNKMSHEKRCIAAIKLKQDMVDGELRLAEDEMTAASQEFEAETQSAQRERTIIEERKNALLTNIQHSTEVFEALEEEHGKLLEQSQEDELKLRHIVEIKEKLCAELDAAAEVNTNLLEQIKCTKQLVTEHSTEGQLIAKENEKLLEYKKSLEEKLTLENKELEKNVQKKTAQIFKYIQMTRACEKEIKELTKQKYRYQNQQNLDIKTVKRCLSEQERLEDELQKTIEDIEKVREKHDQLLIRVNQERTKMHKTEEDLGLESRTLERELEAMGETRLMIQKELTSSTRNYFDMRSKVEKRTQTLTEQKENLETSIATVSSQISRLSDEKLARARAKAAFSSLQSQTNVKFMKMEETLESSIKENLPIERQLNHDILSTKLKQNKMDGDAENYRMQLKELSPSSVSVEKRLDADRNTIEILLDELKELETQTESDQGLENILKQVYKAAVDRSSQSSSLHQQLMAQRHSFRDDQKLRLQTELHNNKALCSMYVRCQQRHERIKHKMIGSCEKSLLANEQLKDAENICDLHARLHEAMKSYYKLRGTQTKMALLRFQEMSDESNGQIQRICTTIDKQMQSV